MLNDFTRKTKNVLRSLQCDFERMGKMRRILHITLPAVVAVVGFFLSFYMAFEVPEYVQNRDCVNGSLTCNTMLVRSTGPNLVMLFITGLVVTFFAAFVFWAITKEEWHR